MRPDSPRTSKYHMGNRNPHPAALRRPADEPVARDVLMKFLDASTAMLSTALRSDSNLDEMIESALALVKSVARSDVEIMCLRVGEDAHWRAHGLEESDDIRLRSLRRAHLAQIPIDQGLHSLSSTAAKTHLGEEIAGRNGVKKWYCFPLANDEKVIGIVYLGMPNAGDFSGEEKYLLGVFCARAVTAFAFRLQRDALEYAVRARDLVLSVVAHDLRNPLNVIGLAASVLLQRFGDTQARSPIERIMRSASRADRMIRDLLEINAIESGRLSLEKHIIEPADVILGALDSQQALAAEASVILATDLSPDLPQIHADEERLHRVLENLIGNAIKFTGAGGQITVGATGKDSDLLVWVRDSGSGIAPEHVPHIFDRYWSAARAERHGTGLGLSICRGIVEAHNGRIWVESTPGNGTTMFFTLPASPAIARKSHDRKASILIVDDRAENLMALEAILERPEYRLVRATSGEEALSVALREQFAVALIDVAMPGMNGLDVAVNLKALERCRDIPIIFITAFGNDPEEIHKAYSAGGADYLVKPLDTEIVRKKVAVFVELSRRRLGNERPPGRA